MSDPNTALARPVGDQNNLKKLLELSRASLNDVIAENLKAERLIKVALIAASKTPKLLDCTGTSIVQSLMDSARTGLEPDGRRACLVPYGNQCQFQPMYAGLVELAEQHPEVSTVEAHIVYENDEFDFEYGSKPFLKHKPLMTGDRGKPIGVYGIGFYKDGRFKFRFLTPADVEKLKKNNRSSGGAESPWTKWPDAMWESKAAKQVCKWMPQRGALAAALDADDRTEHNAPPPHLPELLPENPPPQAPPAGEPSEAERRSKLLTKLQERTRALGVNLRGAEWDGCKQARWNISKLADMTIDQASEWDALIGDVEQGRMTLEAFLDPEKANVSQDLLKDPPEVYYDAQDGKVIEGVTEQGSLFDGGEEMDV